MKEVSGDNHETERVSIRAKETKTGSQEITVLGRSRREIHSREVAQERVEGFHQDSVTRILQKDGRFMSESDQIRVSSGADEIKAVEHTPNQGWTGRYRLINGQSEIEVSALDPEQMERSTLHETQHFASKNLETVVPDPEGKGYTVYQRVGIRQSRWHHSFETGEDTDVSVTGRGMNEGLTTMYTNRQLYEISREKGLTAERQGIYAHATELCGQLEDIVGEDTLKKAYYGGDLKSLETKVDELAGKGGYESLRDCMDRTLSRDYVERISAMVEAQDILKRMYDNGGM